MRGAVTYKQAYELVVQLLASDPQPRTVKKLMRLHGHSISTAPRAVHDIEWNLYVLRPD